MGRIDYVDILFTRPRPGTRRTFVDKHRYDNRTFETVQTSFEYLKSPPELNAMRDQKLPPSTRWHRSADDVETRS